VQETVLHSHTMLTCPSCGKENPEGFAFCGHCGAELHEPVAALLEERKVVSILFCDLVGFTAASDRQDPEDVRARLRSYHARLRHEIERYGGTVEKFVGDAVMAAFGAPVSHEDDAERAVRAGLGILDAIAELNLAEPELDLKVRVGINTGEAVVAVGARPERGEGLVAGDVVNTAARIQGTAPVNGVAVSEQTYRTTSHVFEYEPLDLVAVKGKAEPLVLWRAKAVRIRFGTDFHEHATPFVGRELEKPLLIGIFERAMQRHSVQLVTVVGEPGVGKSRMVAELFAYMHAKVEIVRWRQGRCLPYGEGITFWALGEIVKREAAILESDSSEVALQKLEAALSPDTPDRQWLIQRLAPLVGVETGAPAERQESFTAWRRYLEGLAAGRETVLVFEDLHWADEALLDFIEHLAEWAEDVPLLIVCSARPELYERRPGWAAGQRNAHTINLSPLSDEETAELVSSLVATTILTPELEHAILERAGGNPLYAEEFVRLLADRGVVRDEIALPESVQALIAARLDTLSSERKSLLQDAAVIGKVFWASAVAEMGSLDPGDVELALHELARKELVRPARTSSMEGESEYSFWHLLVRDVAYAQIPRADRSRRHRAAAAWIERKAGERVEDLAEVLAFHYVQALELAEAAGRPSEAHALAEPARRFLALAGERALGLDTAQAEARLARALELTPVDDPQRPQLVIRWADAAFQAGRPTEAAAALDEVLVMLRANEDVDTTARALQVRSSLSQRLGEGTQVLLAAEAVELLEQESDRAALVAAYEQLANVRSIAGDYAGAIEAADRATTFAASLGLPEPARALGYRGFAGTSLGSPDGIAEMERALALLVERGAGRDASILQNNLAIARYPLQGPARSLKDFERGIAFCEERGLRESVAQLESNVPGLLAELGRVEEALDEVRRLVAIMEERGDLYTLIEVRSVALACRLACGEQAPEHEANWLVQTARTIGTVDISVMGFSAAAGAALVEGAVDDARALLTELQSVAGALGSSYYARALPGAVRVALAAGDRGLAERLAEGIMPRTPLEEHALCTARAELTEHAGQHEEAESLYGEAALRWQEFGNVPERAYALLGRGRSLRALGRPGAEEPLLEARELFASMGYEPMVAEADGLLRPTQVVPAS
jgi:class 3 adenylate cyclase/tetratricopeptide (TPR) repeat protein